MASFSFKVREQKNFVKRELKSIRRNLFETIDTILLLTNHAGKNEIIAPKELIIAQVAKPRGQ